MKNLLIKIKPIVWPLLILGIIALGSGFFFLYTRLNDLAETVSKLEVGSELAKPSVQEVTLKPISPDQSCGEPCKKEIERVVSEAVTTLSGVAKTVVEKQTVVSKSTSGVSYIPLGTTATTKSTDWVDVEDSAVYIDLENEYGAGATVSWEASLKVAHGNGKAFARLYDDTNKIAVDFSELSTENNSTFKQVSSLNLPFWKGRNLYKVQIKSLNSFEITYSGGKIKVSY